MKIFRMRRAFGLSDVIGGRKATETIDFSL